MSLTGCLVGHFFVEKMTVSRQYYWWCFSKLNYNKFNIKNRDVHLRTVLNRICPEDAVYIIFKQKTEKYIKINLLLIVYMVKDSLRITLCSLVAGTITIIGGLAISVISFNDYHRKPYKTGELLERPATEVANKLSYKQLSYVVNNLIDTNKDGRLSDEEIGDAYFSTFGKQLRIRDSSLVVPTEYGVIGMLDSFYSLTEEEGREYLIKHFEEAKPYLKNLEEKSLNQLLTPN